MSDHRRNVCFMLAVLVCGTAGMASAQLTLTGVDSLVFERPESWAMKYFATLTLLTGFGPVQELEPGALIIGLEAGYVPTLSAEERTVGFDGTKEEDVNRTSLFGRPRVAVGLAGGFVLEANYLPPIDISGIAPDLFALALARKMSTANRFRTGLRLTAQHGTFTGDITCSADEIRNGPNLFGCDEPSRDEITIDSASLEVAVARRPRGAGRIEPYFGAAVNVMDLEFQVRADYRGIRDRVRLLTDGTAYSLTLGLAYQTNTDWRWTGELFYSPLDVVRPPSSSTQNDGLFNARFFVSYRVRQPDLEVLTSASGWATLASCPHTRRTPIDA
jgi:hypothetical protein